MSDKSFYCQKDIEDGSKFSCYDQCGHCKVYFKPLEGFDFEDYKKLEKAFEEILNEHSKFMMHPKLWKKYFRDKHNLQKSI